MLKKFRVPARVVTMVLFLMSLPTFPARAGTITWGPATDTEGSSAVSTAGILLKAFDSGGSGDTVNGVPFAAAGSGGDDVRAALHTIGGAAFDQLDDGADLGDLDILLSTGDYAAPIEDSPLTIVLTGVESGKQYELQVFFMDQRNSESSPPAGCVGCADRTVTLTSDINSVTLEADPGNTLDSPFGQYVVGTFSANASTQSFEMNGAGFDQFGTPMFLKQVNAWQLREVPEPSTLLLMGAGFALLGRARATRRSDSETNA